MWCSLIWKFNGNVVAVSMHHLLPWYSFSKFVYFLGCILYLILFSFQLIQALSGEWIRATTPSSWPKEGVPGVQWKFRPYYQDLDSIFSVFSCVSSCISFLWGTLHISSWTMFSSPSWNQHVFACFPFLNGNCLRMINESRSGDRIHVLNIICFVKVFNSSWI